LLNKKVKIKNKYLYTIYNGSYFVIIIVKKKVYRVFRYTELRNNELKTKYLKYKMKYLTLKKLITPFSLKNGTVI